MKKIFSLSLLCASALAFTGCAGEEDDIFSQSAAERLNETAAIYTQRLASSEQGWIMEYYPTSTGQIPQIQGYLLLADFDAKGNVKVAMNNALTNDAYKESSSHWQVISDNGPVLSFNTYNECIHIFSSPDKFPGLGESSTGKGLEGDYEFVVVDIPEGGQHVMLKGKKRGMYVRLTRLDGPTDYQAYLDEVNNFKKLVFSENSPVVPVLDIAGEKYHLPDMSYTIPTVYPYDGDIVTQGVDYPFILTKYNGKMHLRFREEIKATNGSAVQEFVFDEENSVFNAIDGSASKIYVEDTPKSFLIANSTETHEFTISRTDAENSEAFTAIFNQINTELRKLDKKFRIDEFKIKGDAEGNILIGFKQMASLRDLNWYKYTVNADAENLKLDFAGAVSETGNNLMNGAPALADMLQNRFTANINLAPYQTIFDLSKIRAAAADDANFAFIINY